MRASLLAFAGLCFSFSGGLAQQPAPEPAQGPASAIPAQAFSPVGQIAGTIRSGSLPLPGVTITAIHTATGKKYVTSTGEDGSFRIDVRDSGPYAIRAEFSAFAPVDQNIVVSPQNPDAKIGLSMILLSRVRQTTEAKRQLPGSAGAFARGMQRLPLS